MQAARTVSNVSSKEEQASNTQLNSPDVDLYEVTKELQAKVNDQTEKNIGRVDEIINELYIGIGGSAAAKIQNLLSIATDSPAKFWLVEESTLELLLIWYPALSYPAKATLLRFLSHVLSSDNSPVPMKLVTENIKSFSLPAAAAHGSHSSLDLLASSIDLGVGIAHDAESFVQGIKEDILSFLSPFMLRGGAHDLAAKILLCLKPHLIAYRHAYASEAVPLLIAGIDETVEAWQIKERGELIAMLATPSTAEMIVDCLGGLPSLITPSHTRGSVAIIHTLVSRLEQLPDSDELITVLSGLLCSKIQGLVDSDSSIADLESGIVVLYQALVRGSGPLVLSAAVLDQVSSVLIQIGNHGHHVAFLHSKVPEALPFYLSLVGRYARNDPSLIAHLEQLLASGGLDAVLQSDVLPLLAARFPEGPYHSLLQRFIESTGEASSSIKLQLFESLLGLKDDLLKNAFGKKAEYIPSSHADRMHLHLRLPSVDFEPKLSPESYPAPSSAQFLYLWNKYPTRFRGTLVPFKGSSNPKVRVTTVTTDPLSANSLYQQWSGFTFESERQVLILLNYRFRAKSDVPPELIVKSDSELPACLLMEFTLFFRCLA